MARTPAGNRPVGYTQTFLIADGNRMRARVVKTRSRQFLDPDSGELSDLAGINVSQPWRRLDPRHPVGAGEFLPMINRPVVDIYGSEFEGNGPWSYSTDVLKANVGLLVEDSGGDVDLRMGTDFYPMVLGGVGWPSFLGDGNAFVIVFDQTQSEVTTWAILSVKSKSSPNDTLVIEEGFPTTGSLHIHIQAVRPYDRRGILVSGGRRMRLFQGAAYATSPLAVMDSAQPGDRWRMARISNTRTLMVSPTNPSRVMTLRGPREIVPERAATGVDYTDASKTISKTGLGTGYTFSEGDAFEITGGSGVIPGIYPILSVASDTFTLKHSAGASASSDVSLRLLRRNNFDEALAGPVPPFQKASPQSGPDKSFDAARMTVSTGGNVDGGTTAVRIRLLDLDTNAASPFYQVASGIDGETFLDMGANNRVDLVILRLSATNNRVAFDARSHVMQVYRKLSAGADYFLEREIHLADVVKSNGGSSFTLTLTLNDEDLSTKPLLLTGDVLRGVPPAGRDVAVLGDSGIVLIAGKADLDNFTDPVIDGLTYKWPKIDNDNVVHFSRTGAFEPENFPPSASNQILLNKEGDQFQRFATVRNGVLAVMKRGVYLLQSGGLIGVARREIAGSGLGTPWPDSVISFGGMACWATASNVYLFDSSARDQGGQPQAIGNDIGQWLGEAFGDDDNIQSHYDQKRRVLVLRRVTSDNDIQDLEIHLSTGNSCFVDGRTGAGYADSTFAESTPASQSALYSVSDEGAVFRLVKQSKTGSTHPYDGETRQVTTDGTHTVAPESIAKVGGFPTEAAGDSVLFRSSTAAVDGKVRAIRRFDGSGSSATFLATAVPDETRLVMLTASEGVLFYRDSTRTADVFKTVFVSGDGVVTVGGTSTPPGSGAGVMLDLVRDSDTTAVGLHKDALGKVRMVRVDISTGAPVTLLVDEYIFNSQAGTPVAIARLSKGRFAAVFVNTASSNATQTKVVEIEEGGAKFTGGSLFTLAGSIATALRLARIDDDRYLVGIQITTNVSLVVATADGNGTVSAGSSVSVFAASQGFDMVMIDESRFLVLSNNFGNWTLQSATISGEVVTLSSSAAFVTPSASNFQLTMLSATRGVAVWTDSSGTPVIKSLGFTVAADNSITIGAIVSVPNSNSTKQDVAAVGTQGHFIVAHQDTANTDGVLSMGIVYGDTRILSYGATAVGPPNTLPFDALPGLAVGDEIIIGSVPFRARFAPIAGGRLRNSKRVDGLSVWAEPAGRTATTAKTLRLRAFRNLSDTPEKLNMAGDTSVTVPIKGADEVDAEDEARFADLFVEGKTIELELSSEDADVGFSLVDMAAGVRESGDTTEDRSVTE